MIDLYLKFYGTTRYQLAKLTGITPSTLQRWSEMPVEKLPVRSLRAVGMLVGKESWEVLADFEKMAQAENLRGFKEKLNELGVSYPEKEEMLAMLIAELELNGVKIKPFSFNRLENDGGDIEQALDNAIDSLANALENLRNGNAPTTEKDHRN